MSIRKINTNKSVLNFIAYYYAECGLNVYHLCPYFVHRVNLVELEKHFDSVGNHLNNIKNYLDLNNRK